MTRAALAFAKRKRITDMMKTRMYKTVIPWLCAICCLFAIFALAPAYADEEDSSTLKIAVYNNSYFAYQDDQGVWRGTDIECMINVAQRAGFKPMFIDSANDADFLGNLNRGVYDIVADVVRDPERDQNYLFSDAVQGTEYATLAVRLDDDRWIYGNVDQVSHMKIGLIASYTINSVFRKWCTQRGVTPTIIEYPDIESLLAALENSEIDAELYTVMYDKEGLAKCRPIMKILPQDCYFAFRKNDYALKNSFDTTLAQILSNNPFYLTDLKKKYAEQFNSGTILFTKLERQYLRDHPDVTVAMVTDNAPYFEETPDGTGQGILPEYFKILAEKLGIHFTFKNYATYEAAVAAVQKGEADLMSFYTGGLISANQFDLILTDPFLDTTNVLITKAGHTGQNETIAIRHFSLDPAKRELGNALKNSQLKDYGTSAACFRALENDEVNVAIFELPVATWLLNQTNSANYDLKPLPRLTMEICGATRSGNTILCSVLNKGIVATKGDVNGLVANATQSKNTWRTFVARLSPWVIVLVTATLSLLVAGLAWALILLRRRQKERTAVLADQAETERQKLQITAIKKTAEERNQFFANISHDMRTPLNAVLGFSILGRKADVTPTEKDEYLRKIENAGNLMLDLVNDTLTLSRIHSGKLEMKLTACSSNIEEMYKPVFETVRSLAAAKQIHFTVNASEAQCRLVLIDQLNMQKILLNLLTNAVKYTPAGGHVCVRFWNETDADGNVDSLTSVQDDGIGISPEFQSRIFEPFTQEKRPGYESTGTGLGLAIVKQLIDMMGGTITLDSTSNKGSTFTIRQHLQEVTEPAVTPQTPAKPPALDCLTSNKILLCEDNALNQEIACAMLAYHKLEVTTAENGKVGVELFASSPPGTYAAILMDLRMPILDGYEATRLIRKLDRPDAAVIPIIAMTADAFADDIQRCLDSGMNDHIAKPINPQILFTTLAKYLKQ